MKVVILHPPLYPANHKFFNELGKHLELVVFCFGNQPGLHDQWKAKHFISSKNNYSLKVIEGKTNLKRFAVSYRTQMNPSFLFKVKKEKPDIVISVAFWFPSLYMAIFKSVLNCKFLILTDAIKQTEKNNSTFRNLLRSFIARHTNAFIASSDLTVKYLKEQFPAIEVKKSIQTIDVVEWMGKIEELPKKEPLREMLGFSKEKTSLLCVSNYIPLKNLEKLINDIITMPNCELFLIGEGELKPHFETIIKAKDMSHKIKLIQRQEGDQLKKYYKASDIFVFPTNRDTFGYVVVEALASGLPVMCSENAGASSIVENNVNGYVLHPQGDFITSINNTINNLATMSSNALTSVSKYTIKNKAESFFKTLTNIN